MGSRPSVLNVIALPTTSMRYAVTETGREDHVQSASAHHRRRKKLDATVRRRDRLPYGNRKREQEDERAEQLRISQMRW